MPDPNPDTPRPNLICPSCGEQNNCAPARSGTFDTECWCRNVSVSAAALARLPKSERDQACLCQRCARGDQ